MCGIIGYVGPKPAAPILLDGLSRLEYRGYDSAGIAVVSSQRAASILKSVGKLSSLVERIGDGLPEGNLGMGHTRWATHGKPSQENAHPHTDCTGRIIVIHNGIIENYVELKAELAAQGHRFTSETDTETLAHLIEAAMARGAAFPDAFRSVMARVAGGSAVMAACVDEPGLLLAARLGNAGGIVVGFGQGETYVASDLAALAPYTRRAAFLGNREMALVRSTGASFTDLAGRPLDKAPQAVTVDAVNLGKRGYKHYMLKEIHEQPQALTEALVGRVTLAPPSVELEDLGIDPAVLQGVRRVVLVGMGSSYHAAMLGRLYFEQVAGIPADADNASEFRYRQPLLDDHTLVVSITQSGETVDTLAAMELAASRGAPQVVITNTPGSQATRVADATVFMRADLEVGVASTKCYTNAVACLFLLAAYTGALRGALTTERLSSLTHELARLPAAVGTALEQSPHIEEIAHAFHRAQHFLFLGRGPGHATAMEGALKLKEISYIHAEGYPAGEMKHGPISLIDEHMPVLVVAPQDHVYEKMLSNVSEVKARDGTVVALASQGDQRLPALADYVITIPTLHPLLTPIVAAVPLQLLAYYIALRRGCDVDQPRNLAKSVTVE